MDIDSYVLFNLLILSKAEIKNILVSDVMKRGDDMSLFYRLENAADTIYSKQFNRFIDYLMEKNK